MSGRACGEKSYFFKKYTSRLSRICGSDVVVLSVGEDVDCEGSGAVWIYTGRGGEEYPKFNICQIEYFGRKKPSALFLTANGYAGGGQLLRAEGQPAVSVPDAGGAALGLVAGGAGGCRKKKTQNIIWLKSCSRAFLFFDLTSDPDEVDGARGVLGGHPGDPGHVQREGGGSGVRAGGVLHAAEALLLPHAGTVTDFLKIMLFKNGKL